MSDIILVFLPFLVLFGYAMLFALAIRSLATSDPLLNRWTTLTELFVVFTHISWLIWISVKQQQIPVLNLGQGLALASWVMLFSLLCVHIRVQRGALALFIYGLALLLLIFSLYSGIPIRDIDKTPSYGIIFALHTILILIGCSFCFLTGLFGMCYLFLRYDIKHKRFGLLYHHLPPLNLLAKMDLIAGSFTCLFFGLGIIFGFFLDQANTQGYYLKLVLSVVVWMLLCLNILLRTFFKKWGRVPAQLSLISGLVLLIGIAFLIFTYSGHLNPS